jgi:hypothetical protein
VAKPIQSLITNFPRYHHLFLPERGRTSHQE